MSTNEEITGGKDRNYMAKANYDVFGNRKTGYSVRREGADRASAHTATKAQAEKLAKQFSRNQGGGEVRIRRPNGQIMDSDTIPNGNDPCPPRDTVM